MVALPSRSPSAALSTTTGISTRRPRPLSFVATGVDLPDCSMRTSTRATLPRRASTTTVNDVFCPTKRGGVVRDCTPGTVCRHTRYATEPTTATSRIRTRSTQACARDRLVTTDHPIPTRHEPRMWSVHEPVLRTHVAPVSLLAAFVL